MASVTLLRSGEIYNEENIPVLSRRARYLKTGLLLHQHYPSCAEDTLLYPGLREH